METTILLKEKASNNGDAHPSNKHLEEWHRDLTILHEGHWEASRHYERRNTWLSLSTTATATISGSSAFTQFVEQSEKSNKELLIVAVIFAVLAAVLSAVQASFRSLEYVAKHKEAARKFGKLRRDLEEQIDLKRLKNPAEREKFVAPFLKEWAAADEESLPVPSDIYNKVKLENEEKGIKNRWRNLY